MRPLARLLATYPHAPWPDAPVRVTLAITDLDVGGAERALVALALGLDRRRWRPSVVSLSGEGALAGPLRADGIEVICLGVDPKRPTQAVGKLIGTLRTLKPKLIQSFLFHANVTVKLAAPMAGRPWVVGGLRVAERQRTWHLTLDRLTSRLSVGSVCVSEGVRRFSVREGRLDPARLVVIPNGVDLDRFDVAVPVDRASIGVPPGSVLALYVGRFDPQKGLDVLLDAASVVARSRPDWHLAMVGDGPLRSPLLDQAARLPDLDGRVHWLGRRDDVPGLLKAADLLILPSLWEGMPNVVLEAMAAGRAVVATEVEGTEDLVVPDRTGWLVPPGQAFPLAEALIQAATDPTRRHQFGQNGRGRVEAEFTPGQVVAAYERLWAGVLGLDLPTA